MWFKFTLVRQLLIGNLRKNYIKAFVTIFSVILVISTSVAILGWLEVSPKLTINSAFESRGYEVSITERYFAEDGLEILQEYLTTEDIVDSTEIVQKIQFLYNLNNRSDNFNVVNPPENETDFFISVPDLTDSAYLVSDAFLNHTSSLLTFEEGSNTTFHPNNNMTANATGAIISKRFLGQLEEFTNQTLSLGDKFNFSLAGNPLPDYNFWLGNMTPILFENFTINAIYERMPSKYQSFVGLDFHRETLGDGIFLSKSIIPNNTTASHIENSYVQLGKSLFVRVSRDKLQENSRTTDAISEIAYLVQRIYQQGRFRIDVDMQNIYATLYAYEQSRMVLLLMLAPMLMIAEIFFLTHIPHVLRARKDEYQYLRLRGVTNRLQLLIQSLETLILTSIGITVGIGGAIVFLGLLAGTPEFLDIQTVDIWEIGYSILSQSKDFLWIYGTGLIVIGNFVYTIYQFNEILKKLGVLDSDFQQTRMMKGKSVPTIILRVLIPAFLLYLIFTTLIPIALRELGVEGISHQIIPLLVIGLMFFWLFFSYFAPQFFLQIIQGIFETLNFFKSPRRGIAWLNLFRRRKQFQSFLMLMTLSVSLITFSLINIATINLNNVQNAEFITGGNLKLATNDVNVENFSSLLMSSIPEINACVGLPQQTVLMGSVGIVLIGINPENYSNFASNYPIDVINGPPEERVFLSLEEDELHGIIISSYLAEIFKLDIGETLKAIGLLQTSGEYDFHVQAVLDSAPGIGSLFASDIEVGTKSFGGFALVNEKLFTLFGEAEAKTFLVKLQPEANRSTVVNQLNEYSDIRMIYTMESALEFQQQFFKLTGVYGELSLNFFGAILVIILGVAVFYQFLVNERITEYALFQSFGATKGRVTRLAFRETVFLITFSLILGIITGYLLSAGFLSLSQMVITVPNNVYVLSLTVSLPLLSQAISVIAIGIIIAALIPLRKIWRVQIPNILRGE